MNTTRRNVVAGAALMSTTALTGCSTTQPGTIDPAKLAEIIAGVQQAIATACSAIGQVVPTAASILELLLTLLGQSGMSIAVSEAVRQITALIEQYACPDLSGARQYKLGDPLNPTPVVVNGVTVHFLSFKK